MSDELRNKKVAKDGYFTQSRSIGSRTKRHKSNASSRYDDDGEELDDKKDEWLHWDRYLATQPGSNEAQNALNKVIEQHNHKGRQR